MVSALPLSPMIDSETYFHLLTFLFNLSAIPFSAINAFYLTIDKSIFLHLILSYFILIIIINYLIFVIYKQQQFLVHSSGGWKSKIKVLADWFIWWGLILCSTNCAFYLPIVERATRLPQASLIKVVTPFLKGLPTSHNQYFSKYFFFKSPK
jgi:hypothetical protein